MDAITRTKELLRLREVPLSLMVKNEDNPNKMGPRDFDLLCDNFGKTGWTDPSLARPLDCKALRDIAKKYGWPNKPDEEKIVAEMSAKDMKVKIVGGHHRFDAASFLGFDTGPLTIIMDPKFKEEEENFQMVRMNVIRGKMDAQRFFELYNKMASVYSDDILQDLYGFAEEAEFKRLVTKVVKDIKDPVMKAAVKEAVKEVKTIAGLTKILNSLFAKYGDTLPCGFMVFDWNGKESMWLQIEGKTWNALKHVGVICVENKRTVDDVIGKVVQLIASGQLTEVVDAIINDTEEVTLPPGLQVAPTKTNLEQIEQLNQ